MYTPPSVCLSSQFPCLLRIPPIYELNCIFFCHSVSCIPSPAGRTSRGWGILAPRHFKQPKILYFRLLCILAVSHPSIFPPDTSIFPSLCPYVHPGKNNLSDYFGLALWGLWDITDGGGRDGNLLMWRERCWDRGVAPPHCLLPFTLRSECTSLGPSSLGRGSQAQTRRSRVGNHQARDAWDQGKAHL